MQIKKRKKKGQLVMSTIGYRVLLDIEWRGFWRDVKKPGTTQRLFSRPGSGKTRRSPAELQLGPVSLRQRELVTGASRRPVWGGKQSRQTVSRARLDGSEWERLLLAFA